MREEKKSGAYKIYLIVTWLLFLVACDKEWYEAPEEQPVYFEYHFVNYAWGVQDNGWLIDREGTIRRFEFPDTYHSGLHGDYLSLEQLEHNLEQADSLAGTVVFKELENKIRLIQGASEGQITKPQPRGADMGMGTYSCYKYDPEAQAYQIILLSSDGDFQTNNQSTDAERLVKWLKSLL